MRRCSQTRRAMMRRRSPPMPAPRRRTTPSACRRTCSNDPRTPASGSPRRADHPNTTYRGNSMQLSIQLSYSGGFQESADQVVAYEQAGLDMVWVAEAYGYAAVSQMGYLAAKPPTVTIASRILPIDRTTIVSGKQGPARVAL